MLRTLLMFGDVGVGHLELVGEDELAGLSDVALRDGLATAVRERGGSVGRGGGEREAGHAEATLLERGVDESLLLTVEGLALGPLLDEVHDSGVQLTHEVASDVGMVNATDEGHRRQEARAHESERLRRGRELGEACEM